MKSLSDILEQELPDTSPSFIEQVQDLLICSYKSPYRAYHNWGHVQECLKEFDLYTEHLAKKQFFTAPNIYLIPIVLYYHDCIYDPRGVLNEELSSQRAFIDLTALGLDVVKKTKIRDWILFTRHTKPSDLIQGQIVMDIDLAILGKDPVIFGVYEQRIREEYKFVPEEIYKTERAKILKNFLDKPVIYQTEFFRQRYEATARANLKQSILM